MGVYGDDGVLGQAWQSAKVPDEPEAPPEEQSPEVNGVRREMAVTTEQAARYFGKPVGSVITLEHREHAKGRNMPVTFKRLAMHQHDFVAAKNAGNVVLATAINRQFKRDIRIYMEVTGHSVSRVLEDLDEASREDRARAEAPPAKPPVVAPDESSQSMPNPSLVKVPEWYWDASEDEKLAFTRSVINGVREQQRPLEDELHPTSGEMNEEFAHFREHRSRHQVDRFLHHMHAVPVSRGITKAYVDKEFPGWEVNDLKAVFKAAGLIAETPPGAPLRTTDDYRAIHFNDAQDWAVEVSGCIVIVGPAADL